MTAQEKLTGMLAEAGYSVKFLTPARGYWTHKHQDVYRWEGQATREGEEYSLFSWDTVGDCARYGITIHPAEGWNTVEVCAKPKKSRKESP